MCELSPLPDTPLGRDRHCKGGEYEVIGVARHSETHEQMVVYRPLYNATEVRRTRCPQAAIRKGGLCAGECEGGPACLNYFMYEASHPPATPPAA